MSNNTDTIDINSEELLLDFYTRVLACEVKIKAILAFQKTMIKLMVNDKDIANDYSKQFETLLQDALNDLLETHPICKMHLANTVRNGLGSIPGIIISI